MIRLYSAIHVGSRWKIQDRRQIKIETIQKLNITQKQQTMQNTKLMFRVVTRAQSYSVCNIINTNEKTENKKKQKHKNDQFLFLLSVNKIKCECNCI